MTEMEDQFGCGSVPVTVAASIYGKDANWIRAGIIAGWLPIGKATRNGKLITDIKEMDSRLGRINYYISPKLLYEETGYIWKGEDKYVNGHSSRAVQQEPVLDRQTQIL